MTNAPSNFTWTVTSPFSFSSSSTVTSTTTASPTVYKVVGASGTTGTLSVVAGGTTAASISLTACLTDISGDAQICSGNKSYTLNNPPSGTINWTSSNTGILTVSSSGNPVTATRVGSATGSVTLTALSGSKVVATKTISVTTCVNPVISGPSQMYCGTSDVFTITTVSGATYQWFSGDLLELVWPSSTTSATYRAPNDLWWDEQDVIYCKVNGTSYTKKVTAKSCYSPVSTYPNPASSVVNIEIAAEAIASLKTYRGFQSDPVFDIRLYDAMGNLLRQTSTKSATAQFNVNSLPDGVYYLHVYNGINDTPVVQQIVIQH
jgi:hypothetical protein